MPANEWVESLTNIGTGLGAVVAAGFGFRHILSKLNLTTTSDNAQATLIQNLQAERDAHMESSDKLRELLVKAEEQNHLLREELAAMKLYLRLKFGVTDEMIKAEVKGGP